MGDWDWDEEPHTEPFQLGSFAPLEEAPVPDEDDWLGWDHPQGLQPVTEGMIEAIQAAEEAFGDKVRRDPDAAALPYADYLRSPHWLALRKRLLLRSGGYCKCCHRHGQLDFHHLSYDRLGNERESDLLALCHRCHGLAHRITSGWNSHMARGAHELLDAMRWQLWSGSA